MDRTESLELFSRMYPGYFEQEYIRAIPDDHICEEMILDLSTFSPHDLVIPVPEGITFGFFHGNIEDLKESVAAVDEGWVRYYNNPDHAYCAFDGDRVVSFCDVDEMGTFEVGGRTLKIGGPGCVGTIPSMRRRGIGLKMIQNVTELFRERGFDYSYIHYTGVAPWYAKLGYKTILRWNGKGFVD